MEKHTRSSLSRSVEDVTRNHLCEWQETLETQPTKRSRSTTSQARGKEEAHKKVREQGEVPTVFLDYNSFGEASMEEDKVTVIVVKDETMFANKRAQQTNGWSSECVTTLISSDTVELCSKEMESQHWLRCSPQSKRKERTQQFVRTRQRTILNPTGPQRAVQEVMSQVRAMKISSGPALGHHREDGFEGTGVDGRVVGGADQSVFGGS